MVGLVFFLFTFSIGDNTNRFSGRRKKIFILLSLEKNNGEQCHDSGCKKSPFKVMRITGITQITTNQRSSKKSLHSLPYKKWCMQHPTACLRVRRADLPERETVGLKQPLPKIRKPSPPYIIQWARFVLSKVEALINIRNCPTAIITAPQNTERRIPQYLSAMYPPINGVK